jgi:hypothetical protein
MSEHRLQEIVIERPRTGRRLKVKQITGFRKKLNRITQSAHQGDLLRPYLIKPIRTKHLSDHLGPLRRLLRSKVGQPWDSVHSELCQRLDANTMAGRHVLDHVWDYVILHVEMRDGVAYYRGCQAFRCRWGEPITSGYYPRFYVHPHSGCLVLAPYVRPAAWRIAAAEVLPPDTIVVDRLHRYQKLNGVWFWVTLAELPTWGFEWDVVKKQCVSSKQPGSYYAVAKHQCNKKELKLLRQQYPAMREA